MQEQSGSEAFVTELVDSLQAKQHRFRIPGYITAGVVFLGIAVLVVVRRTFPSDWGGWLALTCLSAAVSAAIGGLAFWLLCCLAERKLRVAYLDKFAWYDDRRSANVFLATIARQQLTLVRLRRKLGVVVPTFRCSLCNAAVTPEHGNTSVDCPKCRVHLAVPYSPQCPSCGHTSSRIVTPEEQVTPVQKDSKGTTAGALIYGPVGVLAGGLLDGIRTGIKEMFRGIAVSFHTHKFECSKCKTQWAIRLQPGQRD